MDSLARQSLTLLAGLIEERIGLHYHNADLDLLASKITDRVAAAGFQSVLDYYYYLRYDPDNASEFNALVEILVVNETYFFREADALEVLVDFQLEPAIRRGVRPRVWSAACSSGEEVLTLAMLLDDRGLLGDVELVASDVSERVLARARTGIYSERSLRALPTGVMGRWLEPHGHGARIRPTLHDRVSWRQLNLTDPGAFRDIGTFDAIVCRNVLIYFSDDVTRGVVERLADCLRPNGMFLVGVSESLMRLGTALVCEEHRGVFCYRKAL